MNGKIQKYWKENGTVALSIYYRVRRNCGRELQLYEWKDSEVLERKWHRGIIYLLQDKEEM